MTVETYGPADLYVVALPQERTPQGVRDAVLATLSSGVINLLDLVVVRRQADGSSEVVEIENLGDELGLIGTAARTAVIAGTAQATAGAVSRRQQNRYNQQQADPQAAAEQARLDPAAQQAVYQAQAPQHRLVPHRQRPAPTI